MERVSIPAIMDSAIMVLSEIIRRMVLVKFIMLMALLMKVSSMTTYAMEKVFKFIKMVVNMKASGLMIKEMAEV